MYYKKCERCNSVIDPEQYHSNKGFCDNCIDQLKADIEVAKIWAEKELNNERL